MDFIRKRGALLFAFVLILHCIFFYTSLSEARFITKCLLVPLLIVWLAANAKPGKLPYAALIFAFAGDVLLGLHQGQVFFLLGMMAFIGTHICNTIYFIGLHRGSIGKSKAELIALTLLAILSAIIFTDLKPVLGNFQWPILAYMFMISLMTVSATAVLQDVLMKDIARRFFIPGAALFVVSDALLAMNKFSWHNTAAGAIAMLIYGCAQYLLTTGYIRAARLKNG